MRPFDEDELRDQLTGILGAPPTTLLLSAIRARSEGNALFAEELAAARDPSVDLPASVGAAIATKVERLSANARAVLRVASVIGRTAGYDVLREVTALSDEDLTDALREAVQFRLLELIHVGEAYRFRHALLQDAIYDETLPGERRRLHAAVARSCPTTPIGRPTMPSSLQARSSLVPSQRIRSRSLASRAAAVAATQQSAYAEAATHYERLLEIWDAAGAAMGTTTRAEVRERASWTSFLAGDLERASMHVREGPRSSSRHPIRDLRSGNDRPALLDAVATRPKPTAKAFATLAGLDPDGRPPADRALIQIYRARFLEETGDIAATFELARGMLDDARALGDIDVYGQAAIVYAFLLHHRDLDEALRLLESVRGLADQDGNDVVVADVDLDTDICAQRRPTI